MAENLLPWSVASIKMLLLSGGPGREANSQGSNSPPLRPLTVFRKVIYTQAAASFYTRYIIDKRWQSSIHSSHIPCSLVPGITELGLTLPLAKPTEDVRNQGAAQGLTKHALVRVCIMIILYASHISFPLCCHWSAFE